MTYSGKLALVTGGGSGIGRGLAHQLSSAGAEVIITDVVLDAALGVAQEIVEAGGRARGLPLDVTDDLQWNEVVALIEREHGPVEILCSNAGCSGAGLQLTEARIDFVRWLFDVNVLSTVRAIKAVVPGMKLRGRGSVLFTASATSLWTDVAEGDYTATKHAVLALADTLRMELAGSGIGVSVLCPGPVATSILQNTVSRAQSDLGSAPPERRVTDPAMIERTNALGGRLTPEEVAKIALTGMAAGKFFIFPQPLAVDRGLARYAEIQRERNA